MVLKVEANHSLQSYNTFGLDAKARWFLAMTAEAILPKLADHSSLIDNGIFLLGGGSNILLAKDIDGLVLKNEIQGIEIVSETEESVIIEVGGGVNWHQLVLWAIERNYGGIENLSLIPGTVGAAPIQNIGAYGQELKDVFVGLRAFMFQEQEFRYFDFKECAFGYRDSIFKRSLKGKLCITKVRLQLRRPPHTLNTSYGAIKSVLEKENIQEPTIRHVSDAVIGIRQAKLPDPAQIGNSGSFFKNPIIPASQYDALLKEFPNIVGYPVDEDHKKVAAGWLIDQCGWKGKRVGNTGCYANQALVLVNYGGATGAEVQALAKDIQQSVLQKYGIQLDAEVNIWA